MTTLLADSGDGTLVTLLCKDIPAGIQPPDSELGCLQALGKLARLLEVRSP